MHTAPGFSMVIRQLVSLSFVRSYVIIVRLLCTYVHKIIGYTWLQKRKYINAAH